MAAFLNAKGKRTYYNSFVPDLAITPDTVAEQAACGRARWKIENETFNVLKTNGYNFGHNFGHGNKTVASALIAAAAMRRHLDHRHSPVLHSTHLNTGPERRKYSPKPEFTIAARIKVEARSRGRESAR